MYETTQLYKEFTDFMREIGERLKGWNCLRKLSLCYSQKDCWQWSPQKDEYESFRLPNNTLLGNVAAPIQALVSELHWSDSSFRSLTSSCRSSSDRLELDLVIMVSRIQYVGMNLRVQESYPYQHVAALEQALHTLLGPVDDDVAFDPNDRDLLMRAWEARNNPRCGDPPPFLVYVGQERRTSLVPQILYY
ncbi:hypothetical protein BKA93DRAFT_753970 [Sparassis latifolia]